MDGAAPCDTLNRPPPRRYRPDSAFRAQVELRNRQLIEAMQSNPSASADALAAVLKISKSALGGRWRRLGREGLLIHCRDGRWRLPTPEERLKTDVAETETSEFEIPERTRPRTIRRVGCSTSIFIW
jgi:hypothetical protein